MWLATKPVMQLLGVTPRVADLAQSYAYWSLLGCVAPRLGANRRAGIANPLVAGRRLLPSGVFNALDAYLQTQGTAVPQMVISLVAVGLNVGLNWLLVHGAGPGAPGLGFIGSPVATSLSTVAQLGMLLVAMRWRPITHNPWPVRTWPPPGFAVLVASPPRHPAGLDPRGAEPVRAAHRPGPVISR